LAAVAYAVAAGGPLCYSEIGVGSEIDPGLCEIIRAAALFRVI